jgi:hypothetical protein
MVRGAAPARLKTEDRISTRRHSAATASKRRITLAKVVKSAKKTIFISTLSAKLRVNSRRNLS